MQRKGSPQTRLWPIAFRHAFCLVIILHGFCASANSSLKNAQFSFVLWIFNSVKYDQVTCVLPFFWWPVFQERQPSPFATGRKNSPLFCAYVCFQTCVHTEAGLGCVGFLSPLAYLVLEKVGALADCSTQRYLQPPGLDC